MMKTTICRSYSDLIKIVKFEDRVKYLTLDGIVGEMTFAGHRWLNQLLYQSDEWKRTRREVILRDNGCDLAHEEYMIFGSIYIHHINPITSEDILKRKPCVFDLNNLICASFQTHNAIHYGSDDLISKEPIYRQKYDTCPWR